MTLAVGKQANNIVTIMYYCLQLSWRSNVVCVIQLIEHHDVNPHEITLVKFTCKHYPLRILNYMFIDTRLVSVLLSTTVFSYDTALFTCRVYLKPICKSNA